MKTMFAIWAFVLAFGIVAYAVIGITHT